MNDTWNKGRGRGAALLRSLCGTQEESCIVWPMTRDAVNGYGRVGYNGKLRWAHRLMCEFAHGPAPSDSHEAAHSCGKGHEGCVNPNHLSWKTPSANQKDRRRHNTRGNGDGACSLLPEQVVIIKSLKGKKTQKEVGAMFGVHWTSIGNIWRGVTWAGEKHRRRRRPPKIAA